MIDIEREYQNRLLDFCEPIRKIAMHNPIVRVVVESYAHGGILTISEALSRMVVELNRSEENSNRRLIQFMQKSTHPVVVPNVFRFIE